MPAQHMPSSLPLSAPMLLVTKLLYKPPAYCPKLDKPPAYCPKLDKAPAYCPKLYKALHTAKSCKRPCILPEAIHL